MKIPYTFQRGQVTQGTENQNDLFTTHWKLGDYVDTLMFEMVKKND